MKNSFKQILAALLVFAVVFGALPSDVPFFSFFSQKAEAEAVYMKINAETVRLRPAPGTSDYVAKLTRGTVCEITETLTYKGEQWYKMIVPKSATSPKKYTGYMLSKYLDTMTAEEIAAWQAGSAPTVAAPTATTAPAATVAPSGSTGTAVTGKVYGWTTAGDVHLRKAPNSSDYWDKLAYGTVCEIVGTQVIKGYTWYNVIAPRTGYTSRTYNGYIRQDWFAPMTDAEVKAWQAGTGSSGTGSGSSGTGTTPSEPSVGTPTNASGKIVTGDVNFRSTPEVRDDNKICVIKMGSLVDLLEIPSATDSNHWYKAMYNKQVGYLMSTYVSVVSTTAPSQSTIDNGTVKTIKPGVNLRLTAGGSGNIILQIPKNVELPVKAAIIKQGGYEWYYVEYNGVRGYIRGDCASYTAPATGKVTAAPETVTTPAPQSYSGGYVKTIKANVNVRNKPMGSSLVQVDKKVIMPMLAAPVKNGGYTWYLVRTARGVQGYVRGDCVTECDAAGNKPSSGTTVVNPGTGTTVTGKYIKITMANTNVRKAPAGESIDVASKGSILALGNTNTFSAGGYNWYYVSGDKTGYIRSDCCFVLSDTQAAEYEAGMLSSSATAVPNATTAPVQSTVKAVITTMGGVNLRQAPTKDSEVVKNISKDVVMAYTEIRRVGGNNWYHINYNGTAAWVLDSVVREMTDAEYQQYVAANPGSNIIKGYVKTIKGGVNVRATANGSNIIGRVDKGKIYPYTTNPITAGGYKWYFVNTEVGSGYLRSDILQECDSAGGNASAPSVDTTTGGSSYVAYSTLRRGSKGTDVKNMVTKLKELGYYVGEVTDEFNSAVESAVRSFQAAKKLKVDGLAGQNTLSALYGTAASPSTGSGYKFYPAEKIDWFKGGIQQLWPKGASFRVYDVKTGKTWVARRWSGSNHCDAEPLTAADTATLCSIYGVKNAKEIETLNLWKRRPLLITIGNRTFAASLYGVPHNYPKGDTIRDNNFDGQLCIHFTNSMTHETGHVDSLHQDAIDEAYNSCPAGKK